MNVGLKYDSNSMQLKSNPTQMNSVILQNPATLYLVSPRTLEEPETPKQPTMMPKVQKRIKKLRKNDRKATLDQSTCRRSARLAKMTAN